MRLVPVLLVDFGLVLAALGAIAFVRPIASIGLGTSARAGVVAAAGAILVLAGIFAPAPEQRVSRSASKLDEIVPVWEFDERHETRVRASPAEVERAIRAVTAREIRLFGLLTWLRNPRLPGGGEPESILAAPPDEPILAVALRSGFRALGEEPGREVVIGTLVIAPESIRSLPVEERARRWAALDGERFAALSAPGFAKAAMNFRWTDEGGGWTRLTTETRVHATDPGVRRRFAAYWRLIYPGSSLIRSTWLAAIKERAERGTG